MPEGEVEEEVGFESEEPVNVQPFRARWEPTKEEKDVHETSGHAEFRPCEGVGDVVGVEAPLGGVAQVIFHGVQVVEVGVQVRVRQDRGVEEDGEGQVEVEREVDEDQRETHIYLA